MKGGRTSELAQQIHAALTEEEKAKHKKEYEALLALYITLLSNWRTSEREEALFALAELRAEFAIGHVLEGLDLEIDEAISLLESVGDDSIPELDKDRRDRVYAAVTNLIDFAVCEEYQLFDETFDILGAEGEIDFNSDTYEDLLAICKKYNDTYALVEDSDIKYAGWMAAFWIGLSSNDWLVYWTQNDSKVRPWHMALQGYAARKDEFPSWMIPPIEYNCRCFLEQLDVPIGSAGLKKVIGSAKEYKKPSQLGNVYDESLAKCGRIFGPSHDYFNIKDKDKEMLREFVNRLRTKYYV